MEKPSYMGRQGKQQVRMADIAGILVKRNIASLFECQAKLRFPLSDGCRHPSQDWRRQECLGLAALAHCLVWFGHGQKFTGIFDGAEEQRVVR